MAQKTTGPRTDANKYLFVVLFLLLAYLAFLIVKPFIVTILTAAIVAMIFYPVYKWVLKYTKKTTLASFITLIMIFLILVIPSFFLIQSLSNDTYDAYQTLQQTIDDPDFFAIDCNEGVVCQINNQLKEYTEGLKSQEAISQFGKIARSYSRKYGGDVIKVAADLLVKFFVFIFVLYYLFKEGAELVEYIKRIIPLDPRHQEELIIKSKNTLYAVLYGGFLTGLIQTTLAVIIYLILGLSSPIFLGLLTFVGALTIGTWIAWGPVALWLLLQGLITGVNSLIVKGVILLVLGLLVINTIDNVVKPKIIGMHTNTNVVIILLGLLGGLLLFGPVGVFVGPVILSLFAVVLRIHSFGS
jgi:predicted PurR-regulated permease PerM